MLTRAEVVDLLRRPARDLGDAGAVAFYEVFGLFRLAVIAQQIYYRYHHGQTTNEAYAGFGAGGRLPRAAAVAGSPGGLTG